MPGSTHSRPSRRPPESHARPPWPLTSTGGALYEEWNSPDLDPLFALGKFH